MQRSYLIISVIVTALGVVFMFLPQSIMLQLAPEKITLWEEEVYGTTYSFDTGEHSNIDGFSPYVRIWGIGSVTLNTTIKLIGEEEKEIVNITGNPTEYTLPEAGAWRIQIAGNIIEEAQVTVNAGFYYFKLQEPERITYYPYRFFGYGMTMIGVMASLAIYGWSRKKIETPK